MHHLWCLLLVILVTPPKATGQASSVRDFNQVPNCACEATNQSCICLTDSFQQGLMPCVYNMCPIKAALVINNSTRASCHLPIRDKSVEYKVLSSVLAAVSGIFVIERFTFKLYAKLDFGPDDWFTLISAMINCLSTILNVFGLSANGLGRDIWTLSFGQLTRYGKCLYATAVLYFAEIATIKMSLLFFYLRIFPKILIRQLVWGTIIFNTLCGIVFFVLVAIFQCRPISYFWNRWDNEHEGYCVNINAIAWSNSAINIALDIWMLAIPLSQLKSLNLSRRKKIEAGLMFSIGGLATLVSILRLHSLVTFTFGTLSTNPTWEYFQVTVWSTVEVNIGIICNCMPVLRLLLVRMFPTKFGSNRRYGSDYAARTNQQNGIGDNQSVGTANLRVSASQCKTDTVGIICERSFVVEFEDNDEIQLVQQKQP